MGERSNSITRKKFLKLSGGAVGAGLIATSGFSSSTIAQSTDLLHRTIHSTGEKVPAVGLGTALEFGDITANYSKRKNAIKALIREGGKVIDTSPTYSNVEKIVGRALNELGARDKCFLATKISVRGDKKEGIDQSIQSYKDLKTNSFNLLQVHNLRGTKAHLETINALKKEGKVSYTGVTHFRDSQNEDAARVIENNKIDFIQCHYNLLNRSIEQRVLPAAREHGVAVMINVPFARGGLFGPTAGKGLAIPEWAKEFGVDSWGKFFLKFILGHKDITVVIPGTINDYHVVDNIGALRGRLPTGAERKRMVTFINDL